MRFPMFPRVFVLLTVLVASSAAFAGFIPPHVGENILRSSLTKIEGGIPALIDSMHDTFHAIRGGDPEAIAAQKTRVEKALKAQHELLISIAGHARSYVPDSSLQKALVKGVAQTGTLLTEFAGLYRDLAHALEASENIYPTFDRFEQSKSDLLHALGRLVVCREALTTIP
jgi:hypothetical protein